MSHLPSFEGDPTLSVVHNVETMHGAYAVAEGQLNPYGWGARWAAC